MLTGNHDPRARRGPKLIIQIPCYNEERTLGAALADLPREVTGFDVVEWLVVDDGCEDRTVEVARAYGVDHVVSMGTNKGLARGWSAGIEAAVRLGADVVLNTDADNQYDTRAIPALTEPVVAGRADIAVGCRPITDIPHFSPVKKALQRLGSWGMRKVSGTAVADAPSGFRALSRDAAMRVLVLSDYTYTLETLIHAGRSGMRVVNVPVGVNADLRPSRLVRSIPSYVRRSLFTMIRFWVSYAAPGLLAGVAGVASAAALGASVAWASGAASGGLAAVSALAALTAFVGAVTADGLLLNRKLLADVRRRQLEALAAGKDT